MFNPAPLIAAAAAAAAYYSGAAACCAEAAAEGANPAEAPRMRTQPCDFSCVVCTGCAD